MEVSTQYLRYRLACILYTVPYRLEGYSQDLRYRLACILCTVPYRLEGYSRNSLERMIPLALCGWTLDQLAKVHDVSNVYANYQLALHITGYEQSRAREMVLNAVDLLRSQAANSDQR